MPAACIEFLAALQDRGSASLAEFRGKIQNKTPPPGPGEKATRGVNINQFLGKSPSFFAIFALFYFTMSEERSLNFLEEIVEEDLREGKNGGRVLTRFPPEPNGYLHIGHAKSICLNFGLALKYNGRTNLRFDDTNPVKEDVEYVDSIKEDVHWLGFEWANELYASDYFDQIYAFAQSLIRKGLAYVDDSTAEEIAASKRYAH